MTDRIGMDGTDVVGGGRTVTLTDLIRIPVRRWKLPLIGAVVGLLLGVGYLLLPARYEAVAVVAVRPVVTDPFSYPGPGADRVVNMTVENGLATGTDVIAAVTAATGQSITAARDGLEVELPDGSQVLRFRYTAPSSGHAVAGANAAANAYLRVRQGIYQRQRDAIVASYDASIARISAGRDTIRKSLPTKTTSAGGTSPSITAQLDRLRGLDDQLGQLTPRRAEAAAVDVTPGTITRVAAPPVTSSKDAGVLYALVAMLGGLLFGAVAAFGLEALDRRVRSGAEAAATSRLPILAELRGRRFGRDRGRLAADLRYLALAVLGQLGPIPHRRIVLLSAKPGDLAAGVATGLALALAEQGNTVRWEDLTPDALASRARVLAAATGPVQQIPRPGEPTDATQEIERISDVTEPATHPRPTPLLVIDSAAVARSVRVGAGRIWLGAPPEPEETMITVVQAGPAERDDRGVRAALEAAAVVLVRQDRTRVADLERLAGTLRLTGARALGVVLVSGHD
jgi:Mrp family chromosome partitioning ATPase